MPSTEKVTSYLEDFIQELSMQIDEAKNAVEAAEAEEKVYKTYETTLLIKQRVVGMESDVIDAFYDDLTQAEEILKNLLHRASDYYDRFIVEEEQEPVLLESGYLAGCQAWR